MVSTMLVLRVLLALTCVVGLIWFIGRRFGGGQTQRSSREHVVKLVGRQSVGRHTGVAVVAVGNRRLLLGYGDQQVTLLTELGPVVEPLPDPVAEQTGPRRDWVASALSVAGRVPAQRPAPSLETASPEPAALEQAPEAPTSTLQGSILAPETWRQAVRTLQDRTVRR
ncbi:flagellar biosynthetic protein FliO [Cellulomonas humilata]|uniref:Flagellar biosynthetic protein FliO n=1 Tax=Cellulomonas humilata TaxID=144055 RepID=A0A7Y5ZXE4_9CELL|nr:flagellar biosynthetic protein FliO [Cellulomonas humilata]NUU15871.1 flagellar biosynthetic protein FliO [Cellulomonas humilata]